MPESFGVTPLIVSTWFVSSALMDTRESLVAGAPLIFQVSCKRTLFQSFRPINYFLYRLD